MTRKIYRTAQGKMVDLGALQLQNEHVRAVGNMNVNARGDLVDGRNQPIDSRNQQVAKQYKRQTTNVSDQPVAQSKKSIAPVVTDPEIVAAAPIKQPKSQPEATVIETETPKQGLAAAIAKARTVKQEPMKPAVRNPDGPAKI